MKLRTHEEIQAHLVKLQSQAFLRKVAARKYLILREKATAKQRREFHAELNRFALKAALGHHAFRGAEGRKLKTIAEGRAPRLGTAKDPALGRALLKIGDKLKWAVWALPPERLDKMDEEERYTAIHILKSALQRFYTAGEILRGRSALGRGLTRLGNKRHSRKQGF